MRFKLSTTNREASEMLRLCKASSSEIMPTTALIIFESVTGVTPPGPISTGWTEPIVVPGAIAARSVDTKSIVPALHACAPTGPTHPRIGTFRALLNIFVITSVSVSPPPGVSKRTIKAV